jgi:iron(III) transport system ATP-binding protein
MDDKGIIRQIGSPDEVYERPIDAFVYQFLGIPNFIPVAIKSGQAFIDTDAVQGAAELPLQALADFQARDFRAQKASLPAGLWMSSCPGRYILKQW